MLRRQSQPAADLDYPLSVAAYAGSAAIENVAGCREAM
jgi:hypothetical protein